MLVIAIILVLLWLLICRILDEIEKNKASDLIRQRGNPERCSECGYEKWFFVRGYGAYANCICEECNKKIHKIYLDRQRDIKQNPFSPRYVPLENGGYAIVENRDYDLVKLYCWYKNKAGYVVTKDCDGKRISIHRLLKGLKYVKGYHVHHKNRNPLDNRRKNLIRISAKKHSQLHN